MVEFDLVPFKPSLNATFSHRQGPPLTIKGGLRPLLQDPHFFSFRLTLEFRGPWAQYQWPPLSGPKTYGPDLKERRDQLWLQTCVELFLKASTSERYWEGHYAPTGHWNLFSFARYRHQMTPLTEGEISPLLMGFTYEPKGKEELAFALTMQIPWGLLRQSLAVPAADPLWSFHPTLVLIDALGVPSYWAPAHPPGQPDFHLSSYYPLQLEHTHFVK